MSDVPRVFPAILLTQSSDRVSAQLSHLGPDALPPGDVLVQVEYSSLNYKDALAICRGAPVVRQFPLVPGIDLAGTVVASDDPRFSKGESVLVNGWGLGESRHGGYASLARVPGDFIVKVPDVLSTFQCMAIGTAGYTAMLCLMALERAGLTAGRGPALVTGATGGVGSFAVALLAASGYKVLASTGRPSESGYLKKLGAAEVIDRGALSAPGKPLQKEQWAGAIDCVGGRTLVNVCAGTMYRGAVAACGLADSMEFPATVAPFILRGVTLFGIDSVRAPTGERIEAWNRLARQIDPETVAATAREIALHAVPAAAADLLAGRIRGRLVVKLPEIQHSS